MEKSQPVSYPIMLSTMFFSLVGLCGNFAVVAITLKTKHFRNRSHILIAILGVADFLVCLYMVQLRILMLRGWYFVTNRDCFYIGIVGLYAVNFQSGMILVLGIDRLLAVLLPFKYNQVPVSTYVGMIVTVAVYAGLITFNGWRNTTEDIVAVCLPPTAYTLIPRKVWLGLSFVIAAIVLIVYAITHRLCKNLDANTGNKTNVESIRRLLRTISIVIVVYSFTWFLTVLVLLVIMVLPLSPNMITFLYSLLGWLVIINASSNCFIYYWRFAEYRNAFASLLPLCCQNEVALSPVSQTLQVRTSGHNFQATSRRD